MAIFHDDPSFISASSSVMELVNAVSALTNAVLAGPTQASVFLCFSFAFLCYVCGLASGYWSWVDRLWSITPAIYIVIFAIYDPCPRLVLMAILACLWGFRLSFNFWRKGGYSEEEDYRWPVLRKLFLEKDPFHPLCQEIFQISFVAYYQHILLWLISAPSAIRIYEFSKNNQKNKTFSFNNLLIEDYILTGIFLLLLSFETLADEQQWIFQNKKHSMNDNEKKKKGGDYLRGFCTSGVFKYSRHLNFFCEQSIWWTIYGFSIIPSLHVSSSSSSEASLLGSLNFLINFAILGPILLSLLFLGSTRMTENLSIKKYPLYSVYQQTTPMLIPSFSPGISLDSPQGQEMIISFIAKENEKLKRQKQM